MSAKQILQSWNKLSLPLRIAVGLVLGVFLGIVVPQVQAIGLLGTIFVGALKAVAPVLVFVLVVDSLVNANDHVGRKLGKVIALYLITTFLAAFLAVAASFLFPVTLTLQAPASAQAPSGIYKVITNLLHSLVENPLLAITKGNYMGILVWAIACGFSLKKVATAGTKQSISEFATALTQVVRWVVNLAPVGVAGLVFSSVSSKGLGIFKEYGALLLLLAGTMFVMEFIVSPAIVAVLLRRNPYPLVWRCIKECAITAFFTRSSAANIPMNMRLCDKLGLDKDMYSVSIPLGATINMDGAAIVITIMALAAANTLGIRIDFFSALMLSVISTLAACGTSGVAGGSILLIPLACSLLGIPLEVSMQVVGVGFIIGVLQDSLETALNSSSDVLFAATAEFHTRRKNGEPFHF